jgi:hypothetical protein
MEKRTRKKKVSKKKSTSLGCDTGAGADVSRSETIPGECEAEYVANTISKEGDGESSTRPLPLFSGGLFGFGQPLPDNVPVSGRPTLKLLNLPAKSSS